MLAAQTGAEVTCVFDGAELAAPVLLAPPRGVRVLFSKPGVTADELIRQLVRAEPPGRPVVVVSTDREVADGVAKAGARPVRLAAAPEAALASDASSGTCRRFSGGFREVPDSGRSLTAAVASRVNYFAVCDESSGKEFELVTDFS